MADQRDSLLERYPKTISFLRGQLQKNHLRLVLGAGVSIPIKFPSWPDLVDRIANKIGQVDAIGGKLAQSSLTAKVQYLQNLYTDGLRAQGGFFNSHFRDEEGLAKWHSILRECLYQSAMEPAAHPYLKGLISLFKESKLVVNYNFDDSVERLVADLYPDETRRGRKPFDTTWSLASPLKDDVLTIFHPNGYIPRRRHEYPSDRIVFSDETFSDQIVGEQIGNHSLIHHFLQSTFLLIGLSLDDVSLRQHLRRMALMAPGLNHVLVTYEEFRGCYSEAQKRAISKANFEVYNLLTMFLTTEDVAALIDLLSEERAAFVDRAEKLGVTVKYTYYITGGVGAGKTTSVNQFGSCNVYDEWVEDSPDIISKPFSDLSSNEKECADRWIEKQFALKNRTLRNCVEGIHVGDRCPLDPLTFETSLASDRAGRLQEAIRPGLSNTRLEAGQVFLLNCPPEELQRRLISKNKYWTSEIIQKNVESLKSLYKDNSSPISSYEYDIWQMGKSISRLMFFDDYKPADIDSILVGRLG